MTVNVTVTKAEAYEQAAMTAEYVGAKMGDGAESRERVMITDGAAEQLDRFWREADASLRNALKGQLSDSTCGSAAAMYTFELTSRFDASLADSISDDISSYFVNALLAKWFGIANKPEAADYAARAAAELEDAQRKLCHKKKPSRPTYS